MKKRNLLANVFWNIALVGGPLFIGLVLAINSVNLGSLRLVLLAAFGVEFLLILISGWQGILTARLRSGGYGGYLLKAPATDEIFSGPDPVDVRMGSRIMKDPMAVGPGIAEALLLVSFAIWH